MNVRLSILLCLSAWLLCSSVASAAGQTVVRDVRLWTAPDHTRLVFDLNRNMTYTLFRLHKPERVVIDMQHTRLQANIKKLALPDPVILSIRYGKSKHNGLRMVVDVKEKVQPRSFLLKPSHGKPYRLVVDLMRPEKTHGASALRAQRSKQGIIIAVDAGHGGEDPGAIGPHHVLEKNITLAVAKKLARKINAQPGMRAVMIRKGDYFVPLRRRVYLARKAHADMMISIHADSVRTRTVKGASAYTLSERGATQSRAARALAAKENAADQIGGVASEQADDPLVSRILGDMFRRDSLNSSQLLAEEMLVRLKRVGPIKYPKPKRARFFVLGAMEIPSVLVELDYISNPRREKKLKSKQHQSQLATALFKASVDFFRKMGRLKQAENNHMQALPEAAPDSVGVLAMSEMPGL